MLPVQTTSTLSIPAVRNRDPSRTSPALVADVCQNPSLACFLETLAQGERMEIIRSLFIRRRRFDPSIGVLVAPTQSSFACPHSSISLRFWYNRTDGAAPSFRGSGERSGHNQRRSTRPPHYKTGALLGTPRVRLHQIHAHNSYRVLCPASLGDRRPEVLGGRHALRSRR
jgi:hypothetical protein